MKPREAVSQRLVDVARDLFSRQGFDGTSVRQITSRAHANLGSITYHFGSKEALYHEVLTACAEPLVERVAQAAASDQAPIDRIEAIIRAFFDHVSRNPELPKLLLRELSSGRALPAPAQRAQQHNFGAIVAAIKAGQRDGSIRRGDPLLLGLSVMAQPFHFAIAGKLFLTAAGFDLNDTASRARVVDHVVTTVRRALAA
jgi:TetR/AcrR family transcriptional regulator